MLKHGQELDNEYTIIYLQNRGTMVRTGTNLGYPKFKIRITSAVSSQHAGSTNVILNPQCCAERVPKYAPEMSP